MTTTPERYTCTYQHTIPGDGPDMYVDHGSVTVTVQHDTATGAPILAVDGDCELSRVERVDELIAALQAARSHLVR